MKILKRGRLILTKRYWWVLIVYLIAYFSVILTAPILYFFTPLDEFQAGIYGNILGFVIGLVVILNILKSEFRIPTRGAATTKEVILWSVIGVFMAYFTQALAVMIEMNIFGIEVGSENTAMLMEMTRVAPLFMIITAIVAPILEEIVFRKIIFGVFYKRTNFFIAAFISALIFGIVHGEPIHILIYASMGFVLAYVYVKTKRLIVPIIVHMTLNTITILSQLLLSPEEIEEIQRQWENMQIFIGG